MTIVNSFKWWLLKQLVGNCPVVANVTVRGSLILNTGAWLLNVTFDRTSTPESDIEFRPDAEYREFLDLKTKNPG